jgi:hypothetical protein
MVGSSDRGATRAIAGSRALQPSDFSFYGFGDLRRDELRKILRLGIRTEEPDVSVVNDAVFIPAGAATGNGQPKYAGGIVDADGRTIDTAQMHRKGGKRIGGLAESVTVAPTHEIDDDVVYLGLLFNHYGRVLLESLARVWYLDRVDPSVKVIFNTANAAQGGIAPWLPELFSLFGIPPERVLRLHTSTRLRRAIVPEPLFEQFYSAHEVMVQPFREVAARVAGDVTPSAQPLYLSRRRLSSRQRPVVGEADLEEVLRAEGFHVAYPETMSLEEQVRMINGHTDIVSSLGSAAHSILFALHRPRLHLLASRDDIPANYFLCSALADAPTTFVNCLGAGGRVTADDERRNRRAESFENEAKVRPTDLDAGPQSMPQLLDVPRAVNYLAQQGLLRQRPSLTVAVPGRGIQNQFDEAWLYARVRKASTKSTLPEAIAAEATALAATSWPLSLMLARYYARARDIARSEEMAEQFVTLAANETDSDRLAYYRGDVRGMAGRIARACRPETADRLNQVLADRFPPNSGDSEDAQD